VEQCLPRLLGQGAEDRGGATGLCEQQEAAGDAGEAEAVQ